MLVAGRIERDGAEDSVKIVASLDSKDEAANQIVVQGISVDVSAAEFEDDGRADFFATVMPGDLVEVSGQFDGNLVVADEVEREDD